jgi:hypothetical protein
MKKTLTGPGLNILLLLRVNYRDLICNIYMLLKNYENSSQSFQQMNITTFFSSGTVRAP